MTVSCRPPRRPGQPAACVCRGFDPKCGAWSPVMSGSLTPRSTSTEIAAFLSEARRDPGARRRARTAHIRARRHDEPAADLGLALSLQGQHVRGGGGSRRARRAARLFPRPGRMPILALRLAGRGARRSDARHFRARRHYAMAPRARPCARRSEGGAGRGAGLRRRRDGGGYRGAARVWPANWRSPASRPSCSRKARQAGANGRSRRSRG